MKLLFQAIRAVTVELLGVLLAVSLLFGFTSWGLQKATANTSGWDRQILAVVDSWGAPGNALYAAETRHASQLVEYVAPRPDYYNQVFGTTARNIVRDNWQLDL